MSKTSLVIRCYNEEQHIAKLLTGITQQALKNIEIIMVDSGSTDATLDIASRYPVTILQIKPEEFSFGKALNIGCQAATGDILVLASAHVYPVHKDWLEKLQEPFIDPKIAIAYGKQRGNHNSQYSEHQIFAQWFPEQSILNQPFPFCNNANAAIRRSIWEQNPYDEYLTGLEDLDWAKRVMALGYRIAYVAEAEVIHIHNESPRKTYNRYRREAIALKQIYPHEKFHFWDFLRLFTANLISDYYYAWNDHQLSQNLLAIPLFRLMQFWGTYRGFSQRGLVSNQLRQTFYYPRQLYPPTGIISNQNRPTINYDK